MIPLAYWFYCRRSRSRTIMLYPVNANNVGAPYCGFMQQPRGISITVFIASLWVFPPSFPPSLLPLPFCFFLVSPVSISLSPISFTPPATFLSWLSLLTLSLLLLSLAFHYYLMQHFGDIYTDYCYGSPRACRTMSSSTVSLCISLIESSTTVVTSMYCGIICYFLYIDYCMA